MKILEKLFQKERKLIVGLMSGTSVDGVDAALVKINGSGSATRIDQLVFETFPFPANFKPFLLRNSDARTARLNDIARLDMLVAMLFADAVRKIVHKARRRMSEIDLIGSHGQTIQHLPTPMRLFGRQVHSTLQIGNPSAIAKLTGIVTVGDFRIGDVAVGGSGAPLVPIFDYLMLRSPIANRGVLNVGGIANLTVLPRKCTVDQVLAFDTGPGNMLIDGVMRRCYQKPLDNEGTIASRGQIVPSLLNWMIQHPYLALKPPKSTGRETFGDGFMDRLLKRAHHLHRQDIVTTVTEFTALSIYQSYLAFVRRRVKLDELLVSGGGAYNRYLMEALDRYFEGIRVRTTDAMAISTDAKEAICFALLANETIAGHPGNVPGATGAERQTTLGSICLP